jgi:carbamate kinase
MSHERSSSLVVVALGGNAISPPRGDASFAAERTAIDRAVSELAGSATRDERLLIVHGNGPQVGRLLTAPGIGDAESLDIHVAQTQGEIGYLLAEALDARGVRPSVALITRVIVAADDPGFQNPTKPVGRVLSERPADGPAVEVAGGGWRRVVASPRPQAVIEESAIRELLRTHHVIAGGGGGVALAGESHTRVACPAVVDKDWVAAFLAIHLRAEQLLFVTDVSHAFERFGASDQEPIRVMTAEQARERLAAGVFAPGSMAPKVESAVDYVEATGRQAVIATIGNVAAAIQGESGTTIGGGRHTRS